ncbi:GNAT family N-acetyltransferase [Peribacillus frigoritolerans]|uniref:GNAT family N-acetyltransferase n=1 Tax=Peribacillus frigoritolerans TaxID=450367 RepID=UPI00105A51A9|nr:GNAT family N-acetyltransferase [Peribacillus frigoritolerans]TDL80910.1 GNAT family N-acetyltransferase [Peribacillus frigoritolerans]
MIAIREIAGEENFKKAYPVMSQLRTQLSEEEYLKLLEPMRKQGYRLIGLYEDEQVKALAGIIELTNFYNDKHIYVYDLVTDEAARSRGFGEKLLHYVEQLAEASGCGMITLSSGNQRIDAHRFYEEKMGFDRVSHVFNKKL